MPITPQALVETVAMILGLAENRVKNYDRKLMEAGLRTKKGHGRGSAIMTMNDATILLLAIASTDEINEAPTFAAYLRDFHLHEKFNDLTPLLNLIQGKARDFNRLGSAICAIMNYLANSDPDDDALIYLDVTLAAMVPVWASITLIQKDRRHEIAYIKNVRTSVMGAGLQVKRSLYGFALQAVAKRVAA